MGQMPPVLIQNNQYQAYTHNYNQSNVTMLNQQQAQMPQKDSYKQVPHTGEEDLKGASAPQQAPLSNLFGNQNLSKLGQGFQFNPQNQFLH